MTTPKITIHNVETGEIETREFTAEELAQAQREKDVQTAAEAQKATDKAAILAKLGISEDEVRLLLG
jgi:hypothetical protein